MKIEHLQLRNFQSYASADLDFDEGLTLIHGSNGAGKSTLLRAIFGGLFQTNATTETSSDYSLADLVARGEDEGAVMLSFSAGGTMYTVEWVISVTDDNGERRGSTKSCTLTSPDLDSPIEGVRAVRSFVIDLIGMGAREFANSVYVQQKRFSRLIEATGSERKEILDGLLGLDELDQYIDRTKRARRPVKRQRDDFNARLQEVRERLAEYDEQELLDERQRINDEIEEQQDDLEEAQDYKDKLSQRLDEIQEDIDEHEERIRRRDELEAAIEEKNDTITDLRGNIENAKSTIEERQARIETLESQIEDVDIEEYDIGTADAATNALQAVRDDRDSAYEFVQTTRMNVSSAEDAVERAEADRDEAKEAIDEARQRVDEAERMIHQRLDDIGVPADKDAAPEQAVGEAIKTWASGVDVLDDDTSLDDLDEAIETLTERYNELNDKVAELEATKNTIESDIEAAQEELEELQEEYNRVEAVVDSDDGDPMEAYNEAMDEAEALAEAVDIDVQTADILTLMEDDLRTTADELVDTYHALALNDASTDELETQRDDLKTVHELTTVLARALQYEELAEVASDREDTRNELEELQNRHDDVTGDLAAAREQRTRIDEHRDRGESLSSIADQLSTLDEHRAAVKEAEQQLDEAETAIEEAKDELETAQQANNKAEAKLDTIEDTRDTIEAVVEKYDEISDCRQTIQNSRETIGQYNERIQDLNDAIAADQRRLDEVEESLKDDDMEGLQERKERVEELLADYEGKYDAAQDKLDSLRDELAAVNQDIEALEDEREREENLQQKAEEYDDLVQELTEMIDMYESVKVDLREETLGLLNQYTNDVFKDLYENESYVGVTVDNDYNVRLVTGDGQRIDPDKCSGGEGVITNIALRAGVYRVISEQDESGGDMLPPFILDEPTNHLDDEHVSQIEDAIRSIQEWNVPQVFVVSHRESLVTSADHELYVEKDKATGRSTAVFRDDD